MMSEKGKEEKNTVIKALTIIFRRWKMSYGWLGVEVSLVMLFLHIYHLKK